MKPNKTPKEKLELKIFLDSKDNYQCRFKGKPSEMSEAIAILMHENEHFRNMITLGFLAYRNTSNKIFIKD